jgi:hypothetical protein
VQIVNFSLYLVVYNFIIGVLLMIASEKLGIYGRHLAGSHRVRDTLGPARDVHVWGMRGDNHDWSLSRLLCN